MSADLYLDLLKRAVLGELSDHVELRVLYLRDCLEGRRFFDPAAFWQIDQRFPAWLEAYRAARHEGRTIDDSLETLGGFATMIGRKRLDHIESCLDLIRRDRIPGDLMECGVWRGGVAAFLRGYLKTHADNHRLVWLADSFAGLPVPTCEQDAGCDWSSARYPMLAVPEQTVRDQLARYGLLDDRIRFLPGWFRDTLPNAPPHQLALLHLDGDLYESTRDALAHLYHRLAPGGCVIVDDYGCIPPCRQAADEFRRRNNITEPLTTVDWTAVWWRKPL